MTRVKRKPKPNISILTALDDPNIFQQHFRDPTSWTAWRVFLAALFGLPLDNEQKELFRQCTQREAPNVGGHTEAWLICGRRGGKSFILALVAVYLAAFRSWTQYLAPGERATIIVIAADRKQARTILRYTKGLFDTTPLLRPLIESERAECVDLNNRVSIEVHTASYRTTRGYTIVAALLDELAFWATDENAAEPDCEIINALKPGMASIPGSMLLCASSPYGRKGSLFKAFEKHYGKNDSQTLVWQAATRTMNPSIPQRLIDEALEQDPASAAAEYLAEFRTDIESFVSLEIVKSCIKPGVFERPFRAGLRYFSFCDPSGGSSDSFTIAIAHRDADSLILDCTREIKAPFSPQDVVQEYSALLKSYRIRTVVGDRYAAAWPVEAFAKHGIKYSQSAKPKSDLYLSFLPILNSRRCELLDNQRLVSQLVSLERRVSRSGKDSIDHPSGGRDDVSNVCAGVLTLLATPKSQCFVYFAGSAAGACRRDPVTDEVTHVCPVNGEWRAVDRELSNSEKNACTPGKGIPEPVSLFNTKNGFLPFPPPYRRRQ